jgi:hypothetical protein
MRPLDHPNRRGRSVATAGLLAAVAALAACSSVAPARVFAPVADHTRSEPRSLGERGFAPLAAPPAAVGWDLAVLAFAGDGQNSRYELRATFRDDEVDTASATEWRLVPTFVGAELVDDEGRRFPCVRARIPAERTDEKSEAEADPKNRSFTWIFEVSGSYDFGRVQFVAVHWGFDLNGRTFEITSRFRVA